MSRFGAPVPYEATAVRSASGTELFVKAAGPRLPYVLAAYRKHDAESLFWRHPTAAGVAGEQLDIALAALTGYYLAQAREDLVDGVSPYIRKHQRWCGLAAADWLARRRKW